MSTLWKAATVDPPIMGHAIITCAKIIPCTVYNHCKKPKGPFLSKKQTYNKTNNTGGNPIPVLINEISIVFRGNFLIAIMAPDGTPIKTAIAVAEIETSKDTLRISRISLSQENINSIAF